MFHNLGYKTKQIENGNQKLRDYFSVILVQAIN